MSIAGKKREISVSFSDGNRNGVVLRDDDVWFGLVWVRGDAASEREVVAEDEGKGELELREDE